MIYILSKFLGVFIFNILYKTKLTGLENIPKEGKVILAANHSSFLDPMIIFHSSPRRFNAVTGKWLFDVWWLGYLLKLLSCVPTNGSSGGAVSLLNKGEVVLIFPQGECCNPQSEFSSVHKGVAVLALKTGSPVVPIYISGTYEAWPAGSLFPKFFKKLEVCFGRPLYFEKMASDILSQDILQGVTARIMDEIKSVRKNNNL